MPCRGVRGAITVREDSPEAILSATQELLTEMVNANGILVDDLASALFTLTPDLTSTFPARAARQLGWSHVPLMCVSEIAVPGSLPRCIRVLLHWNTHQSPREIHHVYLREAHQLRPDLSRD